MDSQALLINALRGCNHDGRPPVWLMRQAGRYLPGYRQVRSRYSFLEMCRLPEVAAEVTQQPLRRFPLDAAIVFADILLVLDALGRGLHFQEKVGPVIERPWEPGEVLPDVDMAGSLAYVGETIGILRQSIEVPVIGFAGAPFTVASYLIEGKSSRDLKKTKQLLWRQPEQVRGLIDRLTDWTIDYLRMQVAAGAQALQLFDSWAHVLAYEDFTEWCLQPMARIVKALEPSGVPFILFCRGSGLWARALASCGTAVSLDWQVDLTAVRKDLPNTPLQGNLDPHLIYSPPGILKKRVKSLLDSMEGDPAWVFNLGHGLLPDMDPDQVGRLVDMIHQHPMTARC